MVPSEPPPDDPELEDLKERLVALVTEQVAWSRSNIDRIARFVSASAAQPDFEDLLRAAVVFMHATVEDLSAHGRASDSAKRTRGRVEQHPADRIQRLAASREVLAWGPRGVSRPNRR